MTPEEEMYLELAFLKRFNAATRRHLPPMKDLLELGTNDTTRWARTMRDGVSAALAELIDELELPDAVVERVKAQMIHHLDQQGEEWKKKNLG
jgi:hypothetical protein